MDKKVSIVRCGGYESASDAIDAAINLIGGMERFVRRGDNVVIKPNLVSKKRAGTAVTTDWRFLHAVIKAVEKCGANVTIAESPGGPYNKAVLKSLYETCGVTRAAAGTNARLNYDTEFAEIDFPDGHTVKRFPIIKPILEADVIISLPKLKTHAMTSFTGAVKNMFGTIPGTHKAEMHFRLDAREPFCSMLVDLCEATKPTLSIMDAINCMDGDGPTSGSDHFLGLVLASGNPYALDLAACGIIDYSVRDVDTLKIAADRGLAPYSAEELDIMGEPLADVFCDNFKKPKSHFNLLKLINLPAALNARLTNALAPKPKIDYAECVSCGECARCCPPKAISMKTGKPVIDKEKCIRCFCCQELCPKSAVKIHRPPLNRLMVKLLK